jgi:hypothetical protein
MKKLYLLKALVDLLWFFSIIVIIAMAIFLPFLFFSSDPIEIPMRIGETEVTILDLATKLMLLGLVVAYCFFVYGLFLFRKVLVHFSKRQIFEDTVIVLLNKIGKFFLIASLLAVVVNFITKLYIKSEIKFGIEGGFFDSFLFTASLGLFFMVLSEVFTIGKNIKEENELTI